MRRASFVLLLALALAGCGDQTGAQVQRNSDPSPSDPTSQVQGTRPSPAPGDDAASASSSPSASPSLQESLTPSAATSAPEPVDTSSIAASDDTVAGYRALSDGLNAFFFSAAKAEKKNPDADPQNVAEVMELVGDVLPDGVVLEQFASDGADLMCLSGPSTTYLRLGDGGDAIRESLGRGSCDEKSTDPMTDADVVVDIGFGLGDDGKATYDKRVLKGQNLVDQVPHFGDFLQIVDDAS